MMPTLQFDFPVWFQAVPLKHRTPKMVCGIFHETFEVPEVEPSDVNPVMSLEIAGTVNEYFEIGGRFYNAVGSIDSDAVKAQYKAENSLIPCIRTEHWEMKGEPQKRAKEAGLSLFPKLVPEPGDSHPILSRDWFSETDLGWLDRRRDKAFEYLSNLRCCSGGNLYEPVSEPAFVVSMVTGSGKATSITVDFRASNTEPFYLGYPVAYFRADQQDEALAHAAELAAGHDVCVERFDRRAIVIHDDANLTFDPFPHQVLEAASLVMKANQRNSKGDENVARDIGKILGADADAWRDATQGTFDEDALSRLEELVRESLDQGTTVAPAILVETLLERWDERPIILSATKAVRALDGSSPI
ncbi:hypothetical protein HFN89_05870 [Rhizobium laguerreae]|nr:hypothetical protein [Rhizobium laguerreae]